MRVALSLFPALLAGLLVGCEAAAPAATDPPTLDCDPAIPEQYCFLWQTDEPCQTVSLRSFRVMEGGQIDESGTFTATERWYFFSKGGPSETQVDVVSLTGRISTTFSPSDLGCPNCDVVLEVTLTGVDVQTGWNYDGKREVYALDWVNPNGGFNEDMGFIGARAILNASGRLQDLDSAYVRGVYMPASTEPGSLPGEIRWEPFTNAGRCYERW